jgi:hypothetical protein
MSNIDYRVHLKIVHNKHVRAINDLVAEFDMIKMQIENGFRSEEMNERLQFIEHNMMILQDIYGTLVDTAMTDEDRIISIEAMDCLLTVKI